jgi:hypothetical protein
MPVNKLFILCIPCAVAILYTVYSGHITFFSPAARLFAYEAPLVNADSPTRIWGEYAVFLRPDYTLAEHDAAVGRPANRLIYDFDSVYPGIVYSAQDVDDAHLTAIRADIGVAVVECNDSGASLEPNKRREPTPWTVEDLIRQGRF